MNKLEVILIDDEKDAIEGLSGILTEYCEGIEIQATANNIKEGMACIQKHNPDVVFLDINMPGGSGFDLLEQIEERNFQLVFVTAFDQFAIKAFEFNAFNYLLKPLDIDKVVQTVEELKKANIPSDQQQIKALKQSLQDGELNKLTINTGEGAYFIKLTDIVYIEADGSYSVIHLKEEGKMISSRHLRSFEHLLVDHAFYRIHRSYLVNLKYIKAVLNEDGGTALLENGNKLLVSRRAQKGLNDRLRDMSL